MRMWKPGEMTAGKLFLVLKDELRNFLSVHVQVYWVTSFIFVSYISLVSCLID